MSPNLLPAHITILRRTCLSSLCLISVLFISREAFLSKENGDFFLDYFVSYTQTMDILNIHYFSSSTFSSLEISSTFMSLTTISYINYVLKICFLHYGPIISNFLPHMYAWIFCWCGKRIAFLKVSTSCFRGWKHRGWIPYSPSRFLSEIALFF